MTVQTSFFSFLDGLTLLQAMGVLGSACYLLNYFLLQVGMMDGNGHPYRLGSLIAASLVLASLTEQFNLASAIVQISWIALSLFGFCRAIWIIRRPQKGRASHDPSVDFRRAKPSF